MTALSGVYEIVNKENGKRYVGSASNFTQRFGVHRSDLQRGIHHSRHLQAAWRKYGESVFEFRRLFVCSRANLIFFEQRALDAYVPEYNTTLVAGKNHFGGCRHTPETKVKMALAQRGNTATKGTRRSPEAVAKTAAAHCGMKRSAETRRRISEAMTGKKRGPRSAEHRAKLSAAHRGRSTLSPEAIARMAATKRGRPLSSEHKTKIGAASRAAWARKKAEQPK